MKVNLELYNNGNWQLWQLQSESLLAFHESQTLLLTQT